MKTGENTITEYFSFNQEQGLPTSKKGKTMLLIENEPAWAASIFHDDLVRKSYYNTTGDKRYELSNHLGNVLSVVSDKKIPTFTGSSLTYFNADIKSYSDYYPFGMLVPRRHGNSGDYRYGFGGKELDNDIKGEGNSYDFGSRMLDPRIGRWFAIDPLQRKYPSLSPYAYSGNSPIVFTDYDGEDFGIIINHKDKTITIVANIYTNAQNIETLNKAITKWNDLSGQYYYKTKDSQGQLQYYEINVNIKGTDSGTFVSNDGIEEQIDFSENDDTTFDLLSSKADNDDIGNSLRTVLDSEYPFVVKDRRGKIISKQNRAAATLGYENMYIRCSAENNLGDVVHEIAHLLGFYVHVPGTWVSEAINGVMDSKTGVLVDEGRKEIFKKENISNILGTAGLGNDRGRGKKAEEKGINVNKSGYENIGKKFKKGKVVKKGDVPKDKL